MRAAGWILGSVSLLVLEAIFLLSSTNAVSRDEAWGACKMRWIEQFKPSALAISSGAGATSPEGAYVDACMNSHGYKNTRAPGCLEPSRQVADVACYRGKGSAWDWLGE